MPVPLGAQAVNRRHPLAVGLEFAAGPFSGWVDLARHLRPSANPATAHGLSVFGRTSTTDGTNQITYSSTGTPNLDFTSQPFSVLWVAAVPATSGVYPLGPGRSTYASESSNSGWVFAIRADADSKPGISFQPFANNGVGVYAACSTGAGVITLNKQFVALGVSSGAGGQTLYVDGLRRATASSPNPLSAGSVALTIGQNATAYQSLVAVWSRALTAADAAAFASDPFCFLKPLGA